MPRLWFQSLHLLVVPSRRSIKPIPVLIVPCYTPSPIPSLRESVRIFDHSINCLTILDHILITAAPMKCCLLLSCRSFPILTCHDKVWVVFIVLNSITSGLSHRHSVLFDYSPYCPCSAEILPLVLPFPI